VVHLVSWLNLDGQATVNSHRERLSGASFVAGQLEVLLLVSRLTKVTFIIIPTRARGTHTERGSYYWEPRNHLPRADLG